MKLTGLWWWIDRWRKSTAYTGMTLEEQGAYRNLLDEAALRGGPIPNDENVMARACGDARKWQKVRAAVLARFTLRDDGWRNETMDEVIAESRRRSNKQRDYRNRLGNESCNEAGNATGNTNGNSPPLLTGNKRPPPDPDLVVLPERSPEEPRAHARSGRPIFKGQRLVVFEWQLDDCCQILGKHTNDFDLHEWFYTLDAETVNSNLVIPKRDGGKWLQAELLKEVKRRRLPLAGSQFEEDEDELHVWQCGHCNGIHEGTAAECRTGACLKSRELEAHSK